MKQLNLTNHELELLFDCLEDAIDMAEDEDDDDNEFYEELCELQTKIDMLLD